MLHMQMDAKEIPNKYTEESRVIRCFFKGEKYDR